MSHLIPQSIISCQLPESRDEGPTERIEEKLREIESKTERLKVESSPVEIRNSSVVVRIRREWPNTVSDEGERLSLAPPFLVRKRKERVEAERSQNF